VTYGVYKDDYSPSVPLHFEDTLRSLQRAGLASWDATDRTPVIVKGKCNGKPFTAQIQSITDVDTQFGVGSFIQIDLGECESA
jgi:hypothetical protein